MLAITSAQHALKVMALSLIISPQILTAHDLTGVLEEREIDEVILKEIDARNAFRMPGLLDSLLELAPEAPDQRDAATQQMGLPSYESTLEGVYLARARWPAGSTLKLCFFDGSQTARTNVISAAQPVLDAAGLTLDVGDPNGIRTCSPQQPSLIRVSFRTEGNWSYIGNDALLIPQARPTMGLSGMDRFPALSADQKGTVVHEFLHAMGGLHEHQHPESKCEQEFNWDVIYSSLNWPKEKVDFNIRNLSLFYSSSDLAVSDYDVDSVLHYSLPRHFFIDASSATCRIRKNNSMSDGDIEMLKEMYGN